MIETFKELTGNGKSQDIEISQNEVLAMVPYGPFTEVFLLKKRFAILDLPYKVAREKFVKDDWEKENIYSEGEI